MTPFFGLFVYQYVGPNIPFMIASGLLVFMGLYAYHALRDGVGEFDPETDL